MLDFQAIVTLMTTGGFSLILPLMSNVKAEKFYQRAKKEG